MVSLYDADFFEWTQQTAQLLRAGLYQEIDIAHVADEIESLGRSSYRQLKDIMAMLVTHLLTRDYAPEKNTRTLKLTIQQGRIRAEELLEEMPSLRPKLTRDIAAYYKRAPACGEGNRLRGECIP